MFRIIKFLLLFLVILVAALGISYWRGIDVPVNKNGDSRIFILEAGDSVKIVSAKLEKEGLIGSSKFFEIYIWRTGRESELKAGTYELSPAMNIKQVADILVAGKIVDRERSAVIIEGWGIEDIDEYLYKNGFAKKGEFAEKASRPIGNWDFEFNKPDFLQVAPDTATLEGYLFPDTYRLYEDATVEDIVKKMLDNFGVKISSLKNEIRQKDMSLHEIVTMASILEKEVSGDDGPIVSGILYKRMEVGMRLEVDATINYITKKNNPGSELRDLEIDSPYNTYKYYGLPPGPISNPGLSSILSALRPKDSPYFFYLNRQDTGETIFSKTHDEHVRNKNKYLR